MRKQLCCRLGSILCTMAAVLWLAAGFFLTSAASGKGALDLICKSSDTPLYGMHWNIYRVGERISDDKIEFQGDFADYPVYLPDLTASSLQDAANTLENYAVLDGLSPYASGNSDAGGTVSFTGLEDGLYLVSGEMLSVGSVQYIPIAMFVEITDGKAITAYAKFTVRQKPSLENQMYRVRKVWQYDDSYIQLRPVTIDVEIYRNSTLVETITLNKENEWTYDWLGDSGAIWRVKEINIQGDYKVIYRNNETQYLLVNSRDVLYNTTTPTTTTATDSTTTTTVTTTTTGTGTTLSTDSTDTTTSTSTETTTGSDTSSGDSSITSTTTSGSGKLPQTGQLWWPVPVCGAAGLILFVVGWRLNKKK